MSVLITGGAGFIGSHLAAKLVDDDFEVIILDDLSAGTEKNFSHFAESHSLKFVRGDVRNPYAIGRCFDEVGEVVHLAGMTSVSRSIESPRECAEINVTGTSNVLNACIDHEVSRFVYASSSAVYGDTKRIPIDEEQPLQAISPYAASKISGENLCKTYDGVNCLETICLRFFNVYGPRQGSNGYANVITRFLDRIKSSSPLVIYGDGQQTRDFIHVDDVVELLKEVIVKPTARGTYNVGTGRAVTINRLADIILELSGTPESRTVHVASQSGEVRRSQADVSRLTNEFVFAAKIVLEQGLSNLIKEDLMQPDF